MFMYMRALGTGLLCGFIAAAFVQSAVAADDNKEAASKDLKGAKPSATLEVASEQMRLIMGGTAGKGVLRFNGKEYPFTFKSASAGLGAKAVKKMSATGNVYFLNKIEDFPGKYTSIVQSTMVGSSTVAANYKNDKGVSINLRGTVEGLGLSLGGGIATIELVKE